MSTRHWIFGLLLVGMALVMPTPSHADQEETGLQLAQSGNIMQCMEQCIRAEGSSEKATCKSRCASISSKPPKQRNCMGIYKQCKKSCAKRDKACARACKGQLMNCS